MAKKEIIKIHSGQWQKGTSGNPSGRPKKNNSWAEMFNDILDSSYMCVVLKNKNGTNHKIEINLEDADGAEVSIRKAICVSTTLKALQGDLSATNLIMDRTEGKPAQKIIKEEIEDNETKFNDSVLCKLADELEKNNKINFDDFIS